MSPSESQLRAALHDGDGAGLNPDTVISRARHTRQRRRRTIAAATGSVAGVLAVGAIVSVVTIAASNDSGSSAASGAQPASGALPNRSAAPGETAACSAAARPVQLPAGSAAASAPLFPAPVSALQICVYQQAPASGAASTSISIQYSLAGSPAQAVADRFNRLPASPSNLPCTAELGPTVVLIATQADGQQHRVVGNVGGCGLTVSDSAWRAARDLLLKLINNPVANLSIQPSPPYVSVGPGPS